MSSRLPAQLNSFVGREQEVGRVKELLAETRLLTLIGAGGVGKTRLALRVAADLARALPDGVWLVELAALADDALVATHVANALGLEDQPTRGALETSIELLRTRSALLVVDNCEHLIDACAVLCETILSACVNVRILATSREPLRIPGETTWRVPSLALADDAHASGEAVRLFIDRARAAAPDLALTDDRLSVIGEICRRLDGMPLAIELAAAQVRCLTPEQIAARLDDRFSVLTLGARTVLPRQQTLRATVDWSYALLSEPEQRLCRALSVFAGGWSLDAAESVGDTGADTLRVLTRLVERSLVVADTATGETRYSQLETLRQYGAEELSRRGEDDATRDRHLAWCVDFAEQATARLHSAEQPLWLDRLELEHDNLRTALRWAERRGSELQVRLSNVLWEFWYIRGYLAEGQAWVDAGARRTDVSMQLRARALSAAGALASYRYDFQRGIALDRAAVDIARLLDDRALLAKCVMSLGSAEHDLRLDQEAEAHYAEALQLMLDIGDRYGAGLTRLNQAALARQRGDHARATMLLEDAHPIFRESGDMRRAARAEMYLGMVAFERQDVPHAEEFTRTALYGFRQLGFTPGIADCLEILAAIAAARGQHRRAARLFGAYEALQERVARPLSPEDPALRDTGLRQVHAALGRAVMQHELAIGRALPYEQAVGLALSESTAPEPDIVQSEQQRLTVREREVALLLAQGLTNRQIAQRLVLSERTADAHVRNIFDKLGVNARAQVAVWAATNGLSQT